jgi:hypothetical protein
MPSAAATHIGLRPNTTAATFKGMLAGDKDAEFVIGEEKGTLLFAQVIGESDDPLLTVHRADTGAALPDEHKANVAHLIARLPATLGYLIVVHKTGKPTPFTLVLEAPRQLIFDNASNPVAFTVWLPAHGEAAYLVPPSTWINASLVESGKGAYLTLNAMDDGQQMLKAEGNARTFTGAARNPADEVVLRVHQGTEAGELTLNVQRK